jgi:hypothetical protein
MSDQFNEESYGILKILSVIFHPIFVPLPAGILTLLLAGYSISGAFLWVSFSAAIIVGPLAIWAVYMLITGQDMNLRQNRFPIYGSLGFLTLLLIVLFRYLSAPPIILGTMYASAISGILGGLINIYSKISLHAGVWAGAAAIIFHYSVMYGLIVAVLTIFVGVIRIKMNRHTIGQIVLAVVLPIISVVSVFWALDLPKPV